MSTLSPFDGTAFEGSPLMPAFFVDQGANHFDLSLEIPEHEDTKLISWFIPDGLPAASNQRHVALERASERIPDRLSWDQGVVTFADPAAEAFRHGRIKFQLAGKKLKGGYLLIRHKKHWRLTKMEDGTLHAPREKGNWLWPCSRIGRDELREYYARVWPALGPLLSDRPVILLRAPHGVSEAMYYEKFSGGELPSDAVEILIAAKTPPDWIVFDLDLPASRTFKELARAVQISQGLFQELGFECLWKLSGKRSLHALLPIAQQYTGAGAFDFSQMLAEIWMAQIKMMDPRSKVRIDFHRNHFHHTIVAPFSPRAATHPGLSLPISAEELSRASKLPYFDLNISEPRLKEATEILKKTLSRVNDLETAFVRIEQAI